MPAPPAEPPWSASPGSLTRPTTDRVKEALFSRLDAFDVIAGARVLDLYAGSGSLGVESASRGADSRGPGGIRCEGQRGLPAERGHDQHGAGRKMVSVHRSKVEPFLDRTQAGVRWDLVFLDPPYPLDEPALAAVLDKLSRIWPRAPSWWWNARHGPPNRTGPRPWNDLRNGNTGKPNSGSPNPALRKVRRRTLTSQRNASS